MHLGERLTNASACPSDICSTNLKSKTNLITKLDFESSITFTSETYSSSTPIQMSHVCNKENTKVRNITYDPSRECKDIKSYMTFSFMKRS